MDFGSLLASTVFMGLAAGWVAGLIRLRASEAAKSRKPVNCPFCLGWWATVAIVPIVTVAGIIPFELSRRGFGVWLVQLLATAAVAAVVNGWIAPPKVEIELPPEV